MTIIQQPPLYCSTNDDLIYTVSDAHTADPVTYPNYKFLCDIYVNGTLIQPLKVAPRPSDKIGYFSIGSIVRNYVAIQLALPDSGVCVQTFGAGEFFVEVQCKFGEEYGFTAYPDIVESTNRTAYNYYNGRITGTTNAIKIVLGKPATTGPNIRSVRIDDKYNFLPFCNEFSTDIPITAEAIVNGIGQGDVTYAVPGVVGMQILNLSVPNLNDNFPGLTIPEDADSFTIQFEGQLFIFNIECERIHTPYTLHFLNQWGGFETFPFRKLSRKTIDMERKTFQQPAFRIDSGGALSYGASTPDGSIGWDKQTTYASNYKEKLKLSTDLLTDHEYQWIRQLVLSPIVYLDDNSGNLVPVTIEANNYEERKIVNDRLTSLQIDVNFGQTLNTQFR